MFVFSFKKYEVTFPVKRSRPSPRCPDYLRESYDLRELIADSQTTYKNHRAHDFDSQPRSQAVFSGHVPNSRPVQVRHDTLELTSEESENHFEKVPSFQ